MADTLSVSPPEIAKPKLPGTLMLGPNNTIAPYAEPSSPASGPTAPAVPSASPPKASGGDAVFNMDTSAINALVQSKQAELSAGADTAVANQKVDAQVLDQTQGIMALSEGAYGNIAKAQALPGGMEGPLARVLGWFDKDYNPAYQATTIKLNELKAQRIQATGQVIKDNNNILPTILGKVSDAAKIAWDAQRDADQLVINKQDMETRRQQADYDRIRALVDVERNNREKLIFDVDSKSTAEKQNILDLIAKGKGGQYQKLGGLIKSSLDKEQIAEENLQIAATQAAKGQREEAHASTVEAIAALPSHYTRPQLEAAEKSGAPIIEMPVGKNPDGSPQTMSIPVNTYREGLTKALATEQQSNTLLAGELTDRAQIIPNATRIVNVSGAVAKFDPRAGAIMKHTAAVMTGLDGKNPDNITQSGMLIQADNKRLDAIIKENAAKRGTPEAKAAMLQWGQTGKFDGTGGTAIVADALGSPYLTTQAAHKNAFNILAGYVANRVQQQTSGGLAFVGNSSPGTGDAVSNQMLLAGLLQSRGKEKITQIANEGLLDPNIRKKVGDSIRDDITLTHVNSTLKALAEAKNAAPIWQELLHADAWNPSEAFGKMQALTLQSHNKIDYGKIFMHTLATEAANSDHTSNSDPSHMMEDDALEASLFNSNPTQAIMNSYGQLLGQARNKAAQDQRAAIQKDLSGQTTTQAMKQMTGEDGLMKYLPGGSWASAVANGTSEFVRQKFFGKTGMDLGQVPSATGTGLTVADIQALYSNHGQP